VGEELWGQLGCMALVCVWVCNVVVVEGACVRIAAALGCDSTVALSVGGECVGGRGSVVTGLGWIG
jgi:hypothetical protein